MPFSTPTICQEFIASFYKTLSSSSTSEANMINALRFCRTPPPPSVRTTPLLPHLRRGSSPELRFRQVIGLATAPDQNPDNMDDSKNTAKETGDLMSHSFGEGYATRSEEEGFGGIYGGNRSTDDDDDDTDNKKESVIHENHPEYDKSQGSEVKEKENSRHQTRAKR